MRSGPVIVLACCALAAPPPAAAAAACPGQDDVLTQGGAAPFSAALACVARSVRSLAPLRVDAQLSTAAQRHATDMVARSYFDHVSPGGGRLTDRLRRAGWVPRRADWEAGEDIAWATGAYATPAHVVADFLASPPHRRILLDGGYDELGIGVAEGTPDMGPDGVTVVLDLGHRADG